MNADQTAALTAIVLLTGLYAFFTLAKTCLVSVRRAQLLAWSSDGAHNDTDVALQDLLNTPARVFATVQVGITLATFATAAITAAVLAPAFARVLVHWQVPHPVRVATVLLTLFTALIASTLGDLVPYSYAQKHPVRAARLVAVPLRGFVWLFSGLAGIALALSNLFVKPFGLTASFASPIVTEEELQTLLEAGAASGAIEEGEKDIIRNVISFGDTDVRQVMTPRIDIAAADVEMDAPALVDLIIRSGHSRIPVYEGTVDAIVGVIHAKDLLPLLVQGAAPQLLRSVARAPYFVPENKRVDDLLEEFRVSNLPIAIVQDEYGGTAGLVTIEDLLEELVGEIQDEYDTEEPLIQIIDDRTLLLDGRMSIPDLNEEIGADIPDDDFETIGGFVFGLFGRQPAVGECIRHNDLKFHVTRTDGRRIQQVRLTHVDPEEPAALDGETPPRPSRASDSRVPETTARDSASS
ncbi:MAG: hemolysin family protein [Capsulimonadaceae bacterium]